MKRALAERAKQSGMANGIGSPMSGPTTTGSRTPNQPLEAQPLKMAKVSSSSSLVTSRVPVSPTRSNSNNALSGMSNGSSTKHNNRGSKRQRETSAPPISSVANLDSEDEDDANQTAFYLRQQNRALGSELRQIKYRYQRLERERDYRRTQCNQACQSISSLQATWTQMESALLTQPNNHDRRSGGDATSSTGASSDAPVSTGNGNSVELVGALMDCIAGLGNKAANSNDTAMNGGDDDDDPESDVDTNDDVMSSSLRRQLSAEESSDLKQLDDMLRITNNISQRANLLQQWVWGLLQNLSDPEKPSLEETEITKLSKQVAKLKAKARRRKLQLEEMARSRDLIQESDRRVRRGLYRLAAKRVPLQEVLKDIERTDEDKKLATNWMAEETARAAMQAISSDNSHLGPTSSGMNHVDGGMSSLDPDAPRSADIIVVEKKLSDVQQVAKARKEQIDKLLVEKEGRERKMNQLTMETSQNSNKNGETENGDTDTIVQKSEIFIQQSADLDSAKKQVDDMKETLERLRTTCSEVMANEAIACKTLEELRDKHEKKWSELAGELEKENADGLYEMVGDIDAELHSGTDSEGNSLTRAVSIVRLEHKLTQALENVRQAETTRQLLTEAVSMNETLQGKVDEFKTKYTALQQATRESKAASLPSAREPSASASGEGGPSTPKPKPSSSSSSSLPPSEKLYKDNKKLQRDIEKYRAARESLKSKYERVEKERDNLFQSNAKLLKQTAEKDDMNAKSLSTILHLKQVTEKMTQEKESLEQQAKSANQVALSARLAENARERVMEEFQKARDEMHANVSEWETKCLSISAEKHELESQLSQQKAKMSAFLKDLTATKDRCDELVSEMTKMEQSKHEMAELLAIAQKEASEAKLRAPTESSGAAGGSGNSNGSTSAFTVDQLATQVSVLKGRLLCPVCNHRDKKCILLRCRHMFCKECVDINIKNRSRKCPACGIRFDTKDVADVWL